jgi:(p)ppGpp synthase/HD superfamily hydrolase
MDAGGRAQLHRQRQDHATIRDAPGMLGMACGIIGEAGGNISALRAHPRQGDFADIEFEIEVHDAKHLTTSPRRCAPTPASRRWSGRGADPFRYGEKVAISAS